MLPSGISILISAFGSVSDSGAEHTAMLVFSKQFDHYEIRIVQSQISTSVNVFHRGWFDTWTKSGTSSWGRLVRKRSRGICSFAAGGLK